jgi:hypothetical protein
VNPYVAAALKKLEDLDAQIKGLTTQRVELIEGMQSICDHDLVVAHRDCSWTYNAPLVVCRSCGALESDHPYPRLLRGKSYSWLPRVSEKEAWGLRR